MRILLLVANHANQVFGTEGFAELRKLGEVVPHSLPLEEQRKLPLTDVMVFHSDEVRRLVKKFLDSSDWVIFASLIAEDYWMWVVKRIPRSQISKVIITADGGGLWREELQPFGVVHFTHHQKAVECIKGICTCGLGDFG